jgi:hypothetical protein
MDADTCKDFERGRELPGDWQSRQTPRRRLLDLRKMSGSRLNLSRDKETTVKIRPDSRRRLPKSPLGVIKPQERSHSLPHWCSVKTAPPLGLGTTRDKRQITPCRRHHTDLDQANITSTGRPEAPGARNPKSTDPNEIEFSEVHSNEVLQKPRNFTHGVQLILTKLSHNNKLLFERFVEMRPLLDAAGLQALFQDLLRFLDSFSRNVDSAERENGGQA